jgi:mono/diheme cytochrome c family protein
MARSNWLVLIAIIGCGKSAPPAQTPEPSAVATPAPMMPVDNTAVIARGEYVATIAGCMTCHSPDRSRPLAGGPIDKWLAPNITPDKETGIGNWKDEQVIAAIRQGVRYDGVRLLPIMPYASYHRMTDDDAKAVVAYLRAQPPIHHRVGRSKAGGMRPIEMEAPVGNVDPRDSAKGHGRYLAALMHCSGCHTQGRDEYAGGMAFKLDDGKTILSPNITSDPDTGIGRWSSDDIVRAVKTMTLPDGNRIRGPMAKYAEAWSKLSEEDARALAAYIKSVPAIRNEVVEPQPQVSSQ